MNTLLALSALGLVTLFSEIFNFKSQIRPLVVFGLLVSLILTIRDFGSGGPLFNGMIVIDQYAVAFSSLLIALTLLWTILSADFFAEPSSKSDHYALIVFGLTGAVCMVQFNNMIMLFLGIEILSVSLYVLAGSRKSDPASNESALKYFLLGAFATGFLLFGMALVYGATGSFDLSVIASNIGTGSLSGSAMLTAGVTLLLVAMAFKVSAAPFHFWAPDVYQGAPTQVTGFMASVVKTAAFAAFLRLFMTAFAGLSDHWASTVWAISALTILVGNVAAAAQNNIKRMLSYSSVAHAGYMLISVLALKNNASSALLFYTASYAVSSLLSFSILLIVSDKAGSETIDGFRGLARKSPVLAGLTIVAMLSLAGIPPTAGFFAKYYLFTAAIDAGRISLVVIAVAGSLIGVYYYFRPIMAVFGTEQDVQPISIRPATLFTLLFMAAVSLFLGLYPGLLTTLLR